MSPTFIVPLLVLVLCLFTAFTAPVRPRRFFLTLYDQPNSGGTSQALGTSNGTETPCWDVVLSCVQSYEVNDEAVNVTFYSTQNCLGTNLGEYTGSQSVLNSLTALSVSVKKIDPQNPQTQSVKKASVHVHH
ncbi:hypothetical protein BC938DRAFT_475561 [Jimgerdemannia flammicorona]|uniref:Uncharacterized protein n=1 Tax=Jimgerdemannia flammicorona TaxID=994334 RepID=A0A433PSM1_9FUNG|nr:hypothetical protein BC938DRAFT_475561 [Jimgerdemannia flammicorona]